jgi:hypothetical protein
MSGASLHSLMVSHLLIIRERKMKQYLISINEKVWEVTHHDYTIIDPDNLTNNDRINN